MAAAGRSWIFRLAFTSLALAVLSACGGGGAETVQNPITVGSAPASYSGPPPATDDVQAFKVNVWDNLKATNRCGQCHNANGQAPQFVRQDDVNLAYAAANTVVTLSSPRDSRMVSKVAGGHNCWLASNDACGDILTTWIAAWAGVAGSGVTGVELKPPPIRDPGESKSYPAEPALFATTVYPLLEEYCSRCHSPASATSQSPFFASGDIAEAYDAVKLKIDLDRPEASRLVLRLRDEFHNCWSDCAANANEMETAIRAFADQVPATVVDSSLVLSKALGLYDGTVASGGNRYSANIIGLWEFKTGRGSVAYDTSGVEPALNLTLSGDDVSWVGGWGINIRSGKAQGSTGASRKLHDLIKGTGEYSVEAWVAPGNVAQEDARIVSYSGGTTARNFMVGQTLYSYDFYNRSSMTDQGGDPKLTTSAEDEDLQATLQHVVTTYDPVNGRRVYVNGEYTDDLDPVAGGTIADWDDTFAFVLGNEVSGDRQFQGMLRLVAVYNRALTPAQIRQNFDAGVGEKFYLLFSVSHLVDMPEAYILFEVSQFDSYSYLFDKPTFISLDPDAQPGSIALAGMRIGINGSEAEVGQAYRKLDLTVNDASYSASGQLLSGIGTVIGLQKGPESDEFFLTFDQLGGHSNVRTEPVPLAPGPAPDVLRPADVGLRIFDEVNRTMASLTGVSPQHPEVRATYETVKQALPTIESIDTFVSAHPVAIAQLAIQYCDALVSDAGARATYFPGFDFNAQPAQAFSAAGRGIVIDALAGRMVAQGLATEPAPDEVSAELDNLITRLTACGGSCPTGRTETVVKASCAALLGSAVTLVH